MEASGLLKIYNFILKEQEAKRYLLMQPASHFCILFIECVKSFQTFSDCFCLNYVFKLSEV